jgi:hypothetical protein
VPAVPAGDFHEAVARHGGGIDHAGGETPLAMLKTKFDSQGKARGYSAHYIVTDRRLFGRVEAGNAPRTFTEVPFAYLTGVPPKLGAMAQSVLIHVGNQPRKLYIAPKQLHAFFAAMRAPAEPATSAAMAALVEPMTVLAREIVSGKGSGPQGWRTALPRPALRSLLGEMLGQASSPHPDILDFTVNGGSSGAGRAVASTVVGLASLATLGVGWVTTSHGQRLDSVRVQLADLPGGGCAYRLLGNQGRPLSEHWWRVVDAINQAVLRTEARYLLGRAVFGAELPADALAGIPREIVETTIAPMIGPTSLALFYPG